MLGIGAYDADKGNLIRIIENKKMIDILEQVKVQKEPIQGIRLDIEINNQAIHSVLSVLPLVDIMHRIRGLVLVIENKSNEKNLEAQVIRADRLASLSELASGIAHEIRSPMGIIKTISQVLNNETDDKDIKEGLGVINLEIDRANRVIESLLNFSKPQESIMKETSIKNLIQEVMRIIEKYAKEHKVIIRYDAVEDINFMADNEKLKQVFINIIFNSIQAIENDGNIRIKSKVDGDWLKITFMDNGWGIMKEDLRKIFNPFFTTKEYGSGLGMSIVNRIVQDHEGYVNVDSSYGEGTTVNIYLPIKKDKGDE